MEQISCRSNLRKTEPKGRAPVGDYAWIGASPFVLHSIGALVKPFRAAYPGPFELD